MYFKRSAINVTFIEKDKKTCEALKKNLIKLSIIKKVQLFNDKIENTIIDLNNKKFNLIFWTLLFLIKHLLVILNI